MLQALRSLAFLAILLISTAAGAAEIKPFAREDMASDAVRLTETLRIATASIGAEVKARRPINCAKRPPLPTSATSAAPRSSPARRSPPLPRTPPTGSLTPMSRSRLTTRRRMTATTSSPAGRPPPTPPICARRRPTRRPRRSPLLSDLLARHEQWRPALDALKASLDRRDAIDVRKTYEAMRAEHGFRILDYKVDNEFDLAARLFQLSPSSWRARRTFLPMSRSPARPTPRSRTRTSRSASRD